MKRITMLLAMMALLVSVKVSASEFEVVADSLTVDNQINLSSVAYFNTMAAPPADPSAGATGFTTPGGMYFDGTNYNLWDNNTSSWKIIPFTSAVTGSGTNNFIPRWTPSGTQLGNSTLQDDGSGAGVATAPVGGNVLTVGGVGHIAATNTGDVNIGNTGNTNVTSSGDVSVTNGGNVSVNPTGYSDTLGMTTAVVGGVTTVYEGHGTGGPVMFRLK